MAETRPVQLGRRIRKLVPDVLYEGVTVRQLLRPVRFGFLVDPCNPASVERAIEAATSSWGGPLCPLIPHFKQRTTWHGYDDEDPSAITEGMLQAFEPDILVTCGSAPGRVSFRNDKSKTVCVDEFFNESADHPGHSMRHVYRHIFEKERKFESQHHRDVLLHESAEPLSPMMQGALWGRVIDERLLNGLSWIGAEGCSAGAQTIVDAGLDFLTPLDLCMYMVKRITDVRILMLVMDSDNVIDVIDYWNLRAMGRNVVPIPTSLVADVADGIRARIADANFSAGTRTRPIRLIRGRSIDMAEFNDISDLFVGEGVEQQHWVPRFFQSDNRIHDSNLRTSATASHTSSLVPVGKSVALESPDLELIHKSDSTVCITLDVSMPFGHEYTRTLPPDIGDMDHLLGAVGAYNGGFRYTSEGYTRTARKLYGMSISSRIELPTSDAMFRHWFKGIGVSTEPSNAGRIARQMHRMVPGRGDTDMLLRPEILRIFGEATRSHLRVIPLERILYALNKTYHKDRVERELKRLSEFGGLYPGLLSKCDSCNQTNWIAFDRLSPSVECDRCLARFTLSMTRPPHKKNWGFRLRGPFAMERGAEGAYAVLGVYRAIVESELLHDVTWTSALNMTLDSGQLETDFALVGREMGGRRVHGDPVVVFGEAKLGGALQGSAGSQATRIEQGDIDNATALVHRFPKSAFVFATLADSLDEAERTLIADFVNSRRRSRGGGVMILTGQELMVAGGFLRSWRSNEIGSVARELVEKMDHLPSFRAVCEATNKLHLGIEPSSEWPTFFGM